MDLLALIPLLASRHTTHFLSSHLLLRCSMIRDFVRPQFSGSERWKLRTVGFCLLIFLRSQTWYSQPLQSNEFEAPPHRHSCDNRHASSLRRELWKLSYGLKTGISNCRTFGWCMIRSQRKKRTCVTKICVALPLSDRINPKNTTVATRQNLDFRVHSTFL